MGPEAMSVDEMMKIANQSSLTAPWPSGIGSADSHGPIKPGDSRSHEMHRLSAFLAEAVSILSVVVSMEARSHL